MKNKTTRVRFSKEDLALDNVQKAAEKAEKAADKADKAKARLPSQKKAASKLRAKKISAEAESAKLRFGTAEVSPVNLEGPKRPLSAVRKAGTAVSASAHTTTAEYENDNVGVEALNETEGMAETTGRTVQNLHYSRKLRQYEKAAKEAAEAAEKAKEEAATQTPTPEVEPEKEKSGANPFLLALTLLLVFGGIGGYLYLKTKRKQNSSSGQDPDAGYLDDDDDLDIYELPEEPEVKKEPVSEDDPDYWLDEEDDE